jgi:hypothetical protein
MKRPLIFALASIGFALSLSYGCSSSSDYEGGGRRLYPPGGGDGTVLDTPDTATPADTSSPPPDTSTRDTSPPADSGPDIARPDG